MNLPTLERMSEALRSLSPADRRLLDDAVVALRETGIDVAEGYLAAALNASDEDVCLWAAGIAPDVLGVRCAPLLIRALYDQSSDVRSGAITGISAVRPEALRPLVPRLIADARGPNGLQVMWLIARLEASEAVPTLSDLASSLAVADPRHKLATLTVAFLTRGPAGLGAYLSDPDYCSWAAYFLARLGAADALDALHGGVPAQGLCGSASDEAERHLTDFLAAGHKGFHEVDPAPYQLVRRLESREWMDIADRLGRVADQLSAHDTESSER